MPPSSIVVCRSREGSASENEEVPASLQVSEYVFPCLLGKGGAVRKNQHIDGGVLQKRAKFWGRSQDCRGKKGLQLLGRYVCTVRSRKSGLGKDHHPGIFLGDGKGATYQENGDAEAESKSDHFIQKKNRAAAYQTAGQSEAQQSASQVNNRFCCIGNRLPTNNGMMLEPRGVPSRRMLTGTSLGKLNELWPSRMPNRIGLLPPSPAPLTGLPWRS